MNKNYGEMIDDRTIRFVRLLPGPLDRVWRYIVDSDKRKTWLCAGDIEAKLGGHVDMLFHNESLSTESDIPRPEKYRDMPEKMSFSGKVTRCEPPHVIAHTWEFNDEHSEVCYELEEAGDQVRLTLTHTKLESPDTVLSVSGGWHTHLDILVAVLNKETPPPFWKTHTAWESEYAERLGG